MRKKTRKGRPKSPSGSRSVPKDEEALAALIGTDRFPSVPPDWFLRKYGLRIWMQWVTLHESAQST